MSRKETGKYLKRLKAIKDDKTLTPIEICTLQALATIEENNLNFETTYKKIKMDSHSQTFDISNCNIKRSK